ncbi:hypothetical protein [Paenibacillus marinisediminis]
MKSSLTVPRGEDKITVELTVKEAMALSGQRFNANLEVKPSATRKLLDAIDRKLEAAER